MSLTLRQEDKAGGKRGDRPNAGQPGGLPAPVIAPAYVWLFLAGLVWNIFSGTSGQLLGLPLSPDRPLFLLAVVLLVLDPRNPRLRWRANHLIMILTVAWVLWSWMSTGSVFDTNKAFALSDRIVVPFVMFLVGPLIFRDTATRLLLLKTLALVGVYLGITGIGEILGPQSLVFPRGILNQALGIQFGRARGPFLASEPMGMAATILMVTSAVLAHQEKGWWRIVGGGAALVCALTAVLSLTRSVWAGEVCVLVLCLFAVPALRRVGPVLVAAAVVVSGVLVAVAPSVTSVITSRAETSRSVYDRVLTNDAGARIVDSHPVFGIGWGRFVELSDVWVRQASTIPLTNTRISIHNVFLSLAAETGIAGALLWGLAVISGPLAVVLVRYSRGSEMQAWRLIAACCLLVWIFPTMLSPNPYPFPNNLVWLLAGVAGYGMLVAPRDRSGRPSEPAAGSRTDPLVEESS